MTKGAVYHHFRSKDEVFLAVFESVEQELFDRVATAMTKVDEPLEQLIAGTAAFLDAAVEPRVSRIALIEAPAVLGWEEFRRVDERYFLAGLRLGLAAVTGKPTEGEAAQLQARAMFAALCELAISVAESPKPRRTLVAAKAEARALLEAIAR